MLIPGGCGGLRTSIRDRDSKMGGYFWLRYINTPGSETSILFNFVLVASRFCWFPPKRPNSWMSRYHLKAIYHQFCRVTSQYCSIIFFGSIVCYPYLKALFANTNRGRCKREIGHERTRRTRRRTTTMRRRRKKRTWTVRRTVKDRLRGKTILD